MEGGNFENFNQLRGKSGFIVRNFKFICIVDARHDAMIWDRKAETASNLMVEASF